MSDLQTGTENSTTLAVTAPMALPLVLVADPDAASQARRAEQLRDRGFRVVLARTSFEAIVKATCQLPDLILIDSALAAGADDPSLLLSTCPATAHIPIVHMAGKRLPPRIARMTRPA